MVSFFFFVGAALVCLRRISAFFKFDSNKAETKPKSFQFLSSLSLFFNSCLPFCMIHCNDALQHFHRYGGVSNRRMSLEDSDESFASSPPVPPSVSPESSHYKVPGQPRPPSSAAGRPPSGRPKSASHRVRSARRPATEADSVNVPYIPDHGKCNETFA